MKNMNACEDFLEVILIGHAITAALEFFSMESVDSIPDTDLIPEEASSLPSSLQQALLFQQIKRMIDQ